MGRVGSEFTLDFTQETGKRKPKLQAQAKRSTPPLARSVLQAVGELTAARDRNEGRWCVLQSMAKRSQKPVLKADTSKQG